MTLPPLVKAALPGLLFLFAHTAAWSHGVAEGDKGFIEQSSGPQLIAFAYLGDTLDRIVVDAKTGYDACVAAKGAANCHLSIELGMLPIKQVLLALTLIGLVALIPPIIKKRRERNAAA